MGRAGGPGDALAIPLTGAPGVVVRYTLKTLGVVLLALPVALVVRVVSQVGLCWVLVVI